MDDMEDMDDMSFPSITMTLRLPSDHPISGKQIEEAVADGKLRARGLIHEFLRSLDDTSYFLIGWFFGSSVSLVIVTGKYYDNMEINPEELYSKIGVTLRFHDVSSGGTMTLERRRSYTVEELRELVQTCRDELQKHFSMRD